MAASFVKEALIDFTPKPYVQPDKEVIVDTSVSKPTPSNGSFSCPVANGEFNVQLEIAIAQLSDPDRTFSNLYSTIYLRKVVCDLQAFALISCFMLF